ncbi:T9SS type B sorting domain-containing protein [Flavobacterium sp.]|uniref:T9SS type B sorting domain-containing protein n=1 Tax=Flavobacterium sp. TaxID=239 RepID=UPI00262E359F|nr:T9SS type B sorting domain-containing protein [Flavobacterium sp.]
MKKSLFFMMLLASFAGFSQAITVNTTTYTPSQLVNDVLINSPCTSGQNVVATTGTNFGSVNGIGYFQNVSSNPNFPFTNGVVLSTGDVTKIPGVNPATPNTTTLSDGNAAWTGDADLQSILLSQSGITFNSTNATSLEFQFTPISANFSFDFVFASEEYGLLQCNFSDAFAFILTDLTDNTTTNLAVVAGNQPISVATIRDALYNNNCPSVNPGFFGAYNGSGFGPAINFNGQTIKMTASAVVDVTHVYKIKLVIADGVDSNNIPSPLYDSAVFLGANTFNIGTEVLGIDYVPANATAATPRDAICPGGLMPTLGPVSPIPGTPTYSWFVDGVDINVHTATLNLNALAYNSTHTYTLVYTRQNCDPISDNIIVEVYSPLNAPQPADLFKSCETGATTHSFDLSQNTTLLMASLPSDAIITYHASQGEANSGNNPLAIPYTITHAQALAGVTVFARIKLPTAPCYETKSFLVKYVNDPVVNVPAVDPANTKCAINYPVLPPKAVFNLTSMTNAILGSQTPANAYVLKFYSSYANAVTGGATGLVTNPANFNTASRDFFVRVEINGNPSCFAVTPTNIPTFSVVVTPKAHIDEPSDVLICSTSTGYQLPALTDATAGYFPQDNGMGNQLDTPAETLINTTKTIYVYNNPGGGFCSNKSSFDVVKANLNTLTQDIPTTPICTSYTLPTLEYGVFVANNAPPSSTNPDITGQTITTTTTVYVWVDSEGLSPACSESKPVTINITPFVPILQSDYPNRFDCSSYILGTNMPVNTQLTYWTGPNQTGVQKFFGNPINANTTIYVHQASGTCTNDDVSFQVLIGNSNIVVPGTQNRCSVWQLPAQTVAEYHTASFANGGGTLLPSGFSYTQVGQSTLYLYVPGQPCTYNNTIQVNITLAPIDPIADVPAQCDYYVLPTTQTHIGDYYEGTFPNGVKVADQTNSTNYVVTGAGVHNMYFAQFFNNCSVFENFTVTINDTPIVDSFGDFSAECNTTTFTLPPLSNPSAYYNQPGGVDPIAGNTITQLTSGVRPIYIFQAGATPGTCDAESSFEVTFSIVNVNDVDNIYVCDTDYILPAIDGPGDYYDAPFGPAGTGNKLTPPVHVINNSGTTQTTTFYVYADDGNPVPCRDETSFTVTQYVQPTFNAPSPIVTCQSYVLPPYSDFLTVPAGAVNHYYSAPNGGGPELFPGATLTASQTLYVSAAIITPENTEACPIEQPWSINITPNPVIDPAVSDLSGCDQVVLPTLTTGIYYSDPGYTNQITNLTLTSSQTVYVQAVSAANSSCTATASFDVTVTPSPQLTISTPVVDVCDSYTIPQYNDAIFATPSGAVDRFFLSSGTEVFPGATITTSDVITVEAHNGTCSDSETLTVNISVTPVLAAVTDLSGCDQVQLPVLTVGNYYNDPGHTSLITNTLLTASQTVYVYAESPTNANCSDSDDFEVTITNTPVLDPADIADVYACDQYVLPALNTPGAGYFTGANGSGTPIAAGTVYTSNALIYVHAANGTCTAGDDKLISIYKVDQFTDYNGCAPYVLQPLTAPNANYYTGSNGSGTVLQVGTPITTTQIIYVYGTSAQGSCSSQTSFTVTKLADAVANPVTDPTLTTVCDNDANPDDFVTPIDLDAFTATVLGSQNPADFTVKYYPTSIDADYETNQIATDGTTGVDSAINPVWARIQNATGCHAEVEILVNVVPKPHIDADLTGTVCIDPDTGEVTDAYIESGYPGGSGPGSYSFLWSDAAGNPVATTPNLQTGIAGNYTLVIRANGVNACESDPINVVIIESARPASVSITTVGWFTESQTITVDAVPYVGDGLNFMYSLDGQTPQSEPTFTNVPSGVHEILVSDSNGCGATPAPFSVELVSSPPYFTPNGDGINDIWKLSGMANIPAGSVSEIQLYDRYGKLIVQLTSQGPGWDGTLNGQPLPASDYWFSLKYVDSLGVPKEYKSHFSLVR